MSALGAFLRQRRPAPNGPASKPRAPSLDPARPLLVHAVSTLPPTRAGAEALRAMAARGDLLLPRSARSAPAPGRWRGHMGDFDERAGDADSLFFSVARPLAVAGRRLQQPALAFDLEDVAALGPLGWRPHDLKPVYLVAERPAGSFEEPDGGHRPLTAEVARVLTLRDESAVAELVAAEHRAVAAIQDPVFYDRGVLTVRLPGAVRDADAAADRALEGWPRGAADWAPSVACWVYPRGWLDQIAGRVPAPLAPSPPWLRRPAHRRRRWSRWELPPAVTEVLLAAPLPVALARLQYDPSADHWSPVR